MGVPAKVKKIQHFEFKSLLRKLGMAYGIHLRPDCGHLQRMLWKRLEALSGPAGRDTVTRGVQGGEGAGHPYLDSGLM